jgi:hypothetical protein
MDQEELNQLRIGDLFVNYDPLNADELEAFPENPAIKTLAVIIRGMAEQYGTQLRSVIKANEIGRIRDVEGRLSALEALYDFIDGDISEQLRQNKEK